MINSAAGKGPLIVRPIQAKRQVTIGTGKREIGHTSKIFQRPGDSRLADW